MALTVLLFRFKSCLFLVALLFLAGYSSSLAGSCCVVSESPQVMTSDHAAEHAAEDQAAGVCDDCLCLCHQLVAAPLTLTAPLVFCLFLPIDQASEADDILPDPVPRTPDYPPQLA